MIPLRGSSTRILAFALCVLAADQVSKVLVVSRMYMGQRIELFSFLSLERTTNSGIAFGLATDVPAIVLIAVAVLIVGILLVLGTQLRWRGANLAIGLILGGALGNLLDRAVRGSVVDFIDLPHWPTFNLADVAITIGVLLLIIGSLRSVDRG